MQVDKGDKVAALANEECFFPGYGEALGIPDRGQMCFNFSLKVLKDIQHEISASEMRAKVMLRVQVMVVHGMKTTKRDGLQLFTYISGAFSRSDG